MADTKTVWTARQGANLNKFAKLEETAESVVLVNTPDGITVPGTPFTAANMNRIEEGIAAAHEAVASEALERRRGDDNLSTAVSAETLARREAVAAEAEARKRDISLLSMSRTDVLLPENGFFALYTNQAGELKSASLRMKPDGDLVATAADGEDNRFIFDPVSKNLYFTVEEDL
jgi:hypothetical protein